MLRVVLISALSALVLADPLFAQSALERVRASGRLRVGIDATFPPFGIAEGGEFSGFDVDIARAIARELRVEAEIINAGFDGVFPALQNGTFDVIISAVAITPERSATLLFSDPYVAAGQQIAVRGDSDITGPDDLAGRTVGVQINTTSHFTMEKRPGVTIARYNTIDLALLDLQNKRIDAVASDGPVLWYMLRLSFPGLKTAGPDTPTSTLASCSRKRATTCDAPSMPRCGTCRTAANTRRSTPSGSASPLNKASRLLRRTGLTLRSSRARGPSSFAVSG